MRQLSLVAAVASSIALSTFAQDQAAPPAAPAAAPAAQAIAPWTEAQRSTEAIAQGKEFLLASGKAYRAAPALVETVVVGLAMPGGDRSDESMTIEHGPKNSFRMAMGSMKLLAVDGMAYFLPEEPADKFLERKVEGGLGKTFASMLPGYSAPTGAVAMRDGVEGDALVESLVGMILANPSLAGFRTGGGVTEVLLAGEGGEVTIQFDEQTKLQKRMNASLTPPGAPPELKIDLDMRIENKVSEQLSPPVVFEKGERTLAKDVMELMGSAGEPPMKIKVGDPAPAGVLARLEGGNVDIASLTGKVVVLDFWATWCAPCRKGLPLLDKFASEAKSNAAFADKVQVYAVNVWEDENDDAAARREKVKSFWSNQKLSLETLIDPDSKFIEAFGFSGIPAFVVIGPDGKVAAVHVGYDANLVETLTKDVTAALAAK